MASALRVLARPLYSAGVVLCFHSVTRSRRDVSDSVHVPRAQLGRILFAARSIAEIVPLAELLARHKSGRSTAGLIALTFDDAYHALSEARDTLSQSGGIPLTVFAVANALDTGAAFWWDRVADICEEVSQEQWAEFLDGCGVPQSYRDGHAARGRFYCVRQYILAQYAGRWPSSLEPALTHLEASARRQTVQRSMTMAELRAFAALPGVDIGVHTCSHPVLPLLSEPEGEREISECFRILRAQIENTVPVLAAPFGLFDARTSVIASRAGMSACMTLTGHSLKTQQRNGVPRFCIDRREPVWRLLLRTSAIAEELRTIRGNEPSALPELPSART